MREPVSVIVCTRNEEHRITRMIASVPFAAEVLVLDCGSTDNTVAVAQAAGARVEHEDWLGFSAQKNRAAEHASHDWVLSLDADEIVTPELARSIEAVMAGPLDPRDAYIVDRRGDFLGKMLVNPQRRANHVANARLYHRRHAQWDEAMALHEHVVVEGKTHRLQGALLHFNDLTIEQFLEMFNRYSTAEARTEHARGDRVRVVEILLRPVARFVWTYVFRGAYRLGGHGLVYSGLRAVKDFAVYAKRWELQQGGAQAPDADRPRWGR